MLAHDLGHTPFGHAGERVLDELLAGEGGFDHNRQTLRIVDWLEERYPGFRGLNLTFETREGILKHGCDWDHPVEVPELLAQPSLEAQVADQDHHAEQQHQRGQVHRPVGLLRRDDVQGDHERGAHHGGAGAVQAQEGRAAQRHHRVGGREDQRGRQQALSGRAARRAARRGRPAAGRAR